MFCSLHAARLLCFRGVFHGEWCGKRSDQAKLDSRLLCGRRYPARAERRTTGRSIHTFMITLLADTVTNRPQRVAWISFFFRRRR